MQTTEDYLHSPADEFLLACLLLSISAQVYLGDALEAVDPDDFFDPHFGRLWGCARLVHAAGQRVTKRSLLAEVDTPAVRARLEQISGEPVFVDKIEQSVRTVKETARLRRLAQTLERVKSQIVTADGYSQALGVAWDSLAQLDQADNPVELVPFSQLVDNFRETMAGGLSVGEVIPTPWSEVNEILSGGLHAGRSFIIAGRPGSGKSISGLNVAQGAAEQGFPTLVISQEMSNFEATGRLLAAGAQVEYREITQYAMSPETEFAVTHYGESNRSMPLYLIDKPNLTVEYVAAVARGMKRSVGLDLLVVDYLQLLRASDLGKVREQQVAHISRSFKLLSRELMCAIVVLAQLNRGNVKENRRPVLADLRESGSLEQDQDGVILLHHEELETGPTGMVDFIIAKSRFGPLGTISLRWRGNQARIGD